MVILAGISGGASSYAAKMAVSAGYYNLSASTSDTKVNLQNIGLFRFSYLLPIFDRFEFNAGYSLYVLGSSDIDLGFGPDFGFSYFYLSRNDATRFDNGSVSLKSYEIWRPFVGVQFSQRQYQSVQASYAGLNLNTGTDYSLTERMAVRATATYQMLKGPLSSKVKEFSLVGGLVVDLEP